MTKDTRWDRNLSVAPDAGGPIGHAGAVPLRKLADQCGLTSALGAALGRKGKFPLIDHGIALVSMALAIALPARLVRHARARVLKISRTWPWKGAFLTCWQRLCALPAPT